MPDDDTQINTLDDIRKRLDAVTKEAKMDCDASAHYEQDSLWRGALEAIAEGRVAPREAARLALETLDIVFCRWYS